MAIFQMEINTCKTRPIINYHEKMQQYPSCISWS